jgi:hypothetical protein
MDKNKKDINSAKAQEKRKRVMSEVPFALRASQKEKILTHFKNECAVYRALQQYCS